MDRPNPANNTKDPPLKTQKFYHRLTEKNCKPQREGGKRGFQPQWKTGTGCEKLPSKILTTLHSHIVVLLMPRKSQYFAEAAVRNKNCIMTLWIPLREPDQTHTCAHMCAHSHIYPACIYMNMIAKYTYCEV